MRLILVFFFSIIFNKSFAQVQDSPEIYMTRKIESLDSLAQKLLPRLEKKYGPNISELKKDLKEWNPQIKNWNEIPISSNLYIEYPYPVYVSYHSAPKLEAGISYTKSNTDTETAVQNRNFILYSMYTTSVGNFQEKLVTQEGAINSSQNSPISLGIGTSYLLDKNNRMLNASFYWSSLRPTKISGADDVATNMTTQSEYGANIYFQQKINWADLALYGGFDYEQFSTFNTAAYITGEPLDFNTNKLFYGSLGIGHTIYWGDKKITVKGTYSQSLQSNTSSVNANDKFSGQRLQFFSSVKGESRFTYHVLYKRHMLTGPTNLTIDRFGIGVGFVIF